MIGRAVARSIAEMYAEARSAGKIKGRGRPAKNWPTMFDHLLAAGLVPAHVTSGGRRWVRALGESLDRVAEDLLVGQRDYARAKGREAFMSSLNFKRKCALGGINSGKTRAQAAKSRLEHIAAQYAVAKPIRTAKRLRANLIAAWWCALHPTENRKRLAASLRETGLAD